MMFRAPSRATRMLTLGMLLLVVTTLFAQQFTNAGSNDATTAAAVSDMISKYHISRAKIDDRVSSKLLDNLLKDLDPQKLYFLQADITELGNSRNDLDDQVKEGDVGFAYTTFDLYLNRIEEGIVLAEELIDADHDFGLDESMVVDADELHWAKDPSELRERWRQRIKNQLLTLRLDDTEFDKAREQLHKRYRTLQNTYRQTEDFEKLEMYLSALARTFDPHSSYMSPQSLEDFRIVMELQLQGIGAALRSENGYTIVAQIVPGGAVYKDGRMKIGDKIIGVGQEGEEFVDIVEMKLSKVVRLIRGDKGTKVRLRVKTAATGEVETYEMVRQVIELKSAEVKGEIIDTNERTGRGGSRIGVIDIPSFYRDFRGAQQGRDNFKSTARDVLRVLNQFHDSGGVDAIVVDLRQNGGGALDEAVEVSGLFIDQGPVVQVKQQDGKIKEFEDLIPDSYRGPLVLLCNRLSASASEIFAGVIKDYGRGLIVGDTTTHGKGTVQNVMPVGRQFFRLPILNRKDLGALKLTINQFYRVNGDSTQNRGVRSDIVLPSMLDHMDLGESFLENALEFDRIRAADYKLAGFVRPEMISTLQNSSQSRIAESTDFQKLQKSIARLVSRKNRSTISLNEELRRKELKEEKRDEREQKQDDAAQVDDENAPIFPENYYNDEVLQITLDYLQLLKGFKTVGK